MYPLDNPRFHIPHQVRSLCKALTPLLTAALFVALFVGVGWVVLSLGEKLFHDVMGFSIPLSLALTTISVIGLGFALMFLVEPNKRRFIERHGGWLNIVVLLMLGAAYIITKVVLEDVYNVVQPVTELLKYVFIGITGIVLLAIEKYKKLR